MGLGPSGGILATHLAAAGYPTFGVDIWREHAKAMVENGLSVEGVTSLKSRVEQCCTSVSELAEKEFDYAVVAVKTPYMGDVVKALSSLPGSFKVVSCQNGLDNEEFLVRHYGKERVLRIAVNYAGGVKKPGVFEMVFFQPPNYVGCVCGKKNCTDAEELADIFTKAGLETEPTRDIKRYTWQKTILNAALSPVSAVTGLTMAEVMSGSETSHLVGMLLQEGIDVARAAGYDYGDGFYEHALEYLRRGGHHKPSMLVDLEKGNPTEIDYINGMIASYGARLSVPVPVNAALTALVKGKEKVLKAS